MKNQIEGLKQTEMNFESNNPISSQEEKSKFSFKLNLVPVGAAAFPDPLVKTDILEIKVGDIFANPSITKIIKIIDTRRVAVPQSQADYFKNSSGGSIKELSKYLKSGNFGFCEIEYITLMRNSSIVSNPRRIKFLEINKIYPFGSWNYRKYSSIEEIIKRIQWDISREEDEINVHKGIIASKDYTILELTRAFLPQPATSTQTIEVVQTEPQVITDDLKSDTEKDNELYLKVVA